MTPLHDRKQWNALPTAEAEAVLINLLKTRLPRFELKRFERFSKFGMETYTMVLDYDGCEFVFVPGDTVTLGLDRWTLAPENKRDILKDIDLVRWMLKDIGDDEAALDQYIRERMSPVRTATIDPMIVECAVRETGYFPVNLDDERLVQDDRFAETLRSLQDPGSKTRTYIIGDKYRLEKTSVGIRASLYESASYDELLAEVVRNGFRLPTEDEWEYLCGGGTRSLYPWGDNLDHTKTYRHVDKSPDGAPLYLDTPNHFGLVIANDPYRYEVMMESDYFLKGGDGGTNFCGGACLDLSWLPASTYFRDTNIFDEDMDWKSEITGDYSFVRRIVRI